MLRIESGGSRCPVVDDQRLLAGLERASTPASFLVLISPRSMLSTTVRRPSFEDQAERALQRADAHATRRAVAQVLRLRRVAHATADEDRRADRAVTARPVPFCL
jgi:hypothetical protein